MGVILLIFFTVSIPKGILGLNVPSIISICNESTPISSISLMLYSKLTRSAHIIDGDTAIFFIYFPPISIYNFIIAYNFHSSSINGQMKRFILHVYIANLHIYL